MSLDAGEQAAVIGVGVAVLLTVGAGIFRAASLRGDVNSKWTRRVALATAVLDGKTISELDLLRDDVEDILPAAFNPEQAIADPAPLSDRAARAVKYHRARMRMQGDFVWLRKACPLLVVGLTVAEAAAVALTVHYAELVESTTLRIAGLLLAGMGLIVLVVTTAAYVVLQHRLATAEILAGTGGQPGAEGEE